MSYSANKLKAHSARRMVDFDPDGTGETIVTLNPAASEKCVALSRIGAQGFLAGLVHTVGTGSITSFRIFAAEDAAGTTNPTTVVSHALGSDPNAVGDTLWLEATAEQIKAALATAAYVGVKITLGTGTDECIVFFEEAMSRFAYDGLTADYVS
jgi:hypothetical protein